MAVPAGGGIAVGAVGEEGGAGLAGVVGLVGGGGTYLACYCGVVPDVVRGAGDGRLEVDEKIVQSHGVVAKSNLEEGISRGGAEVHDEGRHSRAIFGHPSEPVEKQLRINHANSRLYSRIGNLIDEANIFEQGGSEQIAHHLLLVKHHDLDFPGVDKIQLLIRRYSVGDLADDAVDPGDVAVAQHGDGLGGGGGGIAVLHVVTGNHVHDVVVGADGVGDPDSDGVHGGIAVGCTDGPYMVEVLDVDVGEGRVDQEVVYFQVGYILSGEAGFDCNRHVAGGHV